MILRQATIKYKGYDPDNLSHASEKRVCVSCENPECKNPIRYVRFNHYTNLCRSCTQKGKRNHAYNNGLFGKSNGMYGKKHSNEDIEKQLRNQPNNKGLNNSMYGKIGDKNPNYGRHCSEKQKQNHSEFMKGRYIGLDNPNWKGGIANVRDHVLPFNQCLKMNNRFKNSHFHHITKSIGIFIPKELHRHISHSLKNGNNMDKINLLSLQFINGGL